MVVFRQVWTLAEQIRAEHCHHIHNGTDQSSKQEIATTDSGGGLLPNSHLIPTKSKAASHE
jgi:hypothetical protein